MEDEIISDKLLDSIEPLTIETTKNIIKQMKHCICKIKNGDKLGTGFFCYIPLDENNNCKTLIIGYDTINDEDIKKNKNIQIFLNDGKEYKIIELNNKRKIFSDEKLGLRILKIEEIDNINNDKYYLEFDTDIFKDDASFKNNSIYIMQYSNNNNALITFGKIKEINEEKINHSCIVQNCSYGSPILNLSNNKIIGIQNKIKNSGFNCGTLIKFSIKKIKEKFLDEQNIENDKNKNIKIENKIHFSLMKKEMLNNFNNTNPVNDNIFPNFPNFIDNQFNNFNQNQFNNLNQSQFNNLNQSQLTNLNQSQLNNFYQNQFNYFNPSQLNNFNQSQFNYFNNNNNFGIINNSMNPNMIYNNFNNSFDNIMNYNNINLNIGNSNLNNINSSQPFNQANNNNLYDELSKGDGLKMNFQFVLEEGIQTNIIANYGTTVHQLLLHYVKKIRKPELEKSKQISFESGSMVEHKKLCFNDQMKIEELFRYNNNTIKVLVPGMSKEIIFKTSTGLINRIYIYFEETVENLLKLYFKNIEKSDSFGKEGKVIFIYNTKQIKFEEKERVNNFFKEKEPIIIVSDPENLLNS